jgi:hypothetical protein
MKHIVKKHSTKRHSAKRHSAKRQSAKRQSVKRHSAKRQSSSMKKKKVKTPKKSLKKISTRYRMKGMGILLNMYGGAISTLENDLNNLKKQLIKAKNEYKKENDYIKKKELKSLINNIKKQIMDTKSKISNLLTGISDTTFKALEHTKIGGGIFDNTAKLAGSKISSFLKSATEKMSEGVSETGKLTGEKLSEGVKSASQKITESTKQKTKGLFSNLNLF